MFLGLYLLCPRLVVLLIGAGLTAGSPTTETTTATWTAGPSTAEATPGTAGGQVAGAEESAPRRLSEAIVSGGTNTTMFGEDRNLTNGSNAINSTTTRTTTTSTSSRPCPEKVLIQGAEAVLATSMGVFQKTDGSDPSYALTSKQMGREIYQNKNNMFLFYNQDSSATGWFVGTSYTSIAVSTLYSTNAQYFTLCPMEGDNYKVWDGSSWSFAYNVTVTPYSTTTTTSTTSTNISTTTNTTRTSTTATTTMTTQTTSTTTNTTTSTSTTSTTTSTTSTTITTTSTTSTTRPSILVKLRVDGRPGGSVSSFWSAADYFILEVTGYDVSGSNILVLDGDTPCGTSIDNTAFLKGPLVHGAAPELVFTGPASAMYRWSGLRLTRGGSYHICYCPPNADCSWHGAFIRLDILSPPLWGTMHEFEVLGPAFQPLQDDLGRPLSKDSAMPGSPSVNETFMLQVVGINLTDVDRVHIVSADRGCGEDSELAMAVDWPGLADNLAGEPGSTGDGTSSRVWPALTLREVATFRVCWCLGISMSDAYLEEPEAVKLAPFYDPNATNTTNGTDTFDVYGATRRAQDPNESNSTNFTTTNAPTTTTSTTSTIDANLSNASGMSRRLGALDGEENVTVDVDTGLEKNVTVYGPCSNASHFDIDLGVFAVAGPTGVAALDDQTGTPNSRVGRNFSLTVFGQGLTDAGRVRIIMPGGGAHVRVLKCGDTVNNTVELEGPLAENPDTLGTANGTGSVAFDQLLVNRGGEFAVCWCSGRRTACSKASDFATTAGYFTSIWAGAHEVLDADENELRAAPGVEFTLQLGGIELSKNDRIRIVETHIPCGGDGTAKNTAQLRGPLTRVPGHSGISYTPGVLTGPGELREDRKRLVWRGLRLYSGGVRRVCWCPGGGQSGSSVTSCSGDRDFYYEVGTFDTIYIRQAWAEGCARTRTPVRLHVAAVGLRPKMDRITLARSVDVCGEAAPRGLAPYGVARDSARADWGYPSMASCEEDPNAAAMPGERKLVCGDRTGTVQVAEPGLYRMCVCARLPGYDCSHPSHYRIPAGDLFEVAGPSDEATGAWQDVVDTSAAGGGATQPPLFLNGPGAPALSAVYAPTPAPEATSRLAVASEDGVIRLWEPETPRMVAELVGHTGPVSSLSWAPDSSYLVSGSTDGTMRLWSTAAGVTPGDDPAHICPWWQKVWKRPGGEATDQVLHDWTTGQCDPLITPNTETGQAGPLPVIGGDATDQEWQDAINYHLGSMVTQWLNLTREGTASQSSVRHGASAERAIDAVEDGRFDAGSCTHTKSQKDPWWQVELGGPYAVRGVKVSNRADCCGEWLSPFFVYVDGVHGTTECAANITIQQGETIEVPCHAVGHRVRIELHKESEVLTLCEVGVRYQTTEDIAASSDLKDLYQLTLKQAARHCEKACTAYRERAMPMCNCGPTFECALMQNCIPRCGLEEHTWAVAPNQRVNAISATILQNGSIVATASPDSIIRLWSIDKGSRQAAPHYYIRTHARPVVALVFSTVIPGLLASAADDSLVIWHDVNMVTSGKELALQTVHRFQSPVGAQQPVLAMAFSADGLWFAVAGSRSATLWKVDTKSLYRTLEPAASASLSNGDVALGAGSAIANVAFASDSRWMALRLPTTVQLWPLAEVAPNPSSTSTEAPSLGEWVPFTSQDLAKTLLQWSVRPGPAANRPVYESRYSDLDGMTLHFTPCNVSAEYHACAKDLPWVRLDLEVPFAFTAVRGSFIEYSEGPNGADDCRGGTNHSSWEDETANRYWVLLVKGMRVEGEDCPHVGGGNLSRNISWQEGATSLVTSLAACQAECVAMGICNFVNWRQHPQSCDMRRCLDATNPALIASPDDDAWAFVLRHEAEERLVPTHDGYVMFGAPDTLAAGGSGGVLYGGCRAGPEISKSGVTIEIIQTTVARTRSLRWQVAQSRNTEKLGIRAVSLELWRPIEGRRSLAMSSSSSLLAFSPARRELTVAVGEGMNLAVWDLRGIDFPAAHKGERLLKKAFSFDLDAVGLLDIDRARIVDAATVPVCGDVFSSTTSMAIQGLKSGRRAMGTHNYSYWDRVIATSPGLYRICFCGGRKTSCCKEDGDFANEVFSFVVAGAASDHYTVCEAGSGQIACIIQDFHGTGIVDGDQIMIQDSPACGLATSYVPGLPNNGVLIARQPNIPADAKYPADSGTWYRFETQNTGQTTYRVEGIPAVGVGNTPAGFTARMCWCPLAANCHYSDPSMFRIDAGLLTVIRFMSVSDNKCQIGKDCLVVMELAPFNTPVVASDLLMVKEGSGPGNRLATRNEPNTCKGAVVQGLGPSADGLSGRMKVGYDTRPNAKIKDTELGLFDFGKAASVPGVYRLCWCQASMRPCLTADDFVADIGKLEVEKVAYVWPDCTAKEVSFTAWRSWGTFDECCCNHHEAGAVGCTSEKTETFARCSKLPRR